MEEQTAVLPFVHSKRIFFSNRPLIEIIGVRLFTQNNKYIDKSIKYIANRNIIVRQYKLFVNQSPSVTSYEHVCYENL